MNTTPAQETDERLTRLEIQLAYAEDLLDTLNTLVAQQQDQITLLLQDKHPVSLTDRKVLSSLAAVAPLLGSVRVASLEPPRHFGIGLERRF